MTEMIKKSLQDAIDNITGKETKDKVITNSDNKWECICYGTTDYDSLNEFIYLFGLNIESKFRNYYCPTTCWSYIRLPKIKIKWQNKISQVKIGSRIYNVIPNCQWENNQCILPTTSNTICKVEPLLHIKNILNTVLIPYDVFEFSVKDEEFKTGDLTCKYPLTHYRISFNRKGIYINRKYRDNITIIDLNTLGNNFVIIEPKIIEIIDIEKQKHTMYL
jgi:hypothetical protein